MSPVRMVMFMMGVLLFGSRANAQFEAPPTLFAGGEAGVKLACLQRDDPTNKFCSFQTEAPFDIEGLSPIRELCLLNVVKGTILNPLGVPGGELCQDVESGQIITLSVAYP